jgi:hypothetical protein
VGEEAVGFAPRNHEAHLCQQVSGEFEQMLLMQSILTENSYYTLSRRQAFVMMV